jgi:FkbM family methyltransferase
MFTSYAQNFEDVMLRRALKHVEEGFYIDIGAQDPVSDSVSKAFHALGWKGIHVEPTPEYAQRLRGDRRGDTVIEAIVGPKTTEPMIYQIEGTGLSTTLADLAQRHAANDFAVKRVDVASVTLDELLDMCAGEEIHWLKIDTEGSESAVIASWEKSLARPWIVVVESVDPISHQINSESWESSIKAKGYKDVYFDGVNKFYLSDAHPELMEKFSSPPNLFDGFTLSGQASSPFANVLVAEKAQLRAEAGRLASEVAALGAERLELNRQIERGRQELEALRRSVSWRITAPLRLFARLCREPLPRLRGAVRLAAKVPFAIMFRLAAFFRRRFPRLFFILATNPIVRRIFDRSRHLHHGQPGLKKARGGAVSRNAQSGGEDVLPALLSGTSRWKPGRRIDV